MTGLLDGPLSGEVVVVTGGAQGIGAGIVARALDQGAQVGTIDLKEFTPPEGVVAVQADVSDGDAVADAFQRLAAELGPATVLVNNAGRNAYFDPVAMTEAEWESFFGVDLKAAWLCARAVLPAMIEARSGSIVNIASLHGKLTTKGMFPYAAAKSGLVGLTRSLALEVAPHGVRVNAVCPGYIRTELVEVYFAEHGAEQEVLDVHPLGRIGTPDEVAQVACFLASAASSYVTGADWAVDGGFGVRFA